MISGHSTLPAWWLACSQIETLNARNGKIETRNATHLWAQTQQPKTSLIILSNRDTTFHLLCQARGDAKGFPLVVLSNEEKDVDNRAMEVGIFR